MGMWRKEEPLNPHQGQDFEHDEEMVKIQKKVDQAREDFYANIKFEVKFCPNCGVDQKCVIQAHGKPNWCFQCGVALHKIDLY